MTYVIAQPCVDVQDKACVDECPVDCIYEGPRKMYIQPDECVDCGACAPVCPVEAIFFEDAVPRSGTVPHRRPGDLRHAWLAGRGRRRRAVRRRPSWW